MNDRFEFHNLHQQGLAFYKEQDPHLRRLQRQTYVYQSPLLEQFPKEPGIFTLTGGRQIGKTTLLKQWILRLLGEGVSETSIFFLTGELIDDHHGLVRVLQDTLSTFPKDRLGFLIIDEITYIKNWDKGIKYLADLGFFENIAVMLTGSDAILLKESRSRFPGRRGRAEQVDYHLSPLSFREVVDLKHGPNQETNLDLLFQVFDDYMVHGGYMTAINDWAKEKSLAPATMATYSDWISGDIQKQGKSESYLREILGAILKTYGSQITWNALGHHISIDHHKTIQDYILLLESMDVLFVQYALQEDKLLPAPKKARKLIFRDPFIFHAVHHWLDRTKNSFLSENHHPILAETIAIAHYARLYETYYIKAEGEVDIAYVHNNHFWPVEIKWTHQIRPKDLKQILKYPNGLILSRSREKSEIAHTPIRPLPLHLYSLGL